MSTESYDGVVDAVTRRLSEPACAHSERVAQSARELAALYGVDPEHAALAGLLHDWDRELGHDGLIEEANRLGLPIDDVELDSPYLLHAKTGALALRSLYPDVPDEVITAVERHTLGAVEMSDLDMVVFIADMIEPGRRYPEADELRESAGVLPLDLLFARAYERSVARVVELRKPMHPRTVEVWNAHVARWRR